MKKRTDGGPAFPASSAAITASLEIVEALPDGPQKTEIADALADNIAGMSLRDFFAAAALQGMLSSGRASIDELLNSKREELATGCYALADALLKARQS